MEKPAPAWNEKNLMRALDIKSLSSCFIHADN